MGEVIQRDPPWKKDWAAAAPSVPNAPWERNWQDFSDVQSGSSDSSSLPPANSIAGMQRALGGGSAIDPETNRPDPNVSRANAPIVAQNVDQGGTIAGAAVPFVINPVGTVVGLGESAIGAYGGGHIARYLAGPEAEEWGKLIGGLAGPLSPALLKRLPGTQASILMKALGKDGATGFLSKTFGATADEAESTLLSAAKSAPGEVKRAITQMTPAETKAAMAAAGWDKGMRLAGSAPQGAASAIEKTLIDSGVSPQTAKAMAAQALGAAPEGAAVSPNLPGVVGPASPEVAAAMRGPLPPGRVVIPPYRGGPAQSPPNLAPPSPEAVSYGAVKGNPQWWDQTQPRSQIYRGITGAEAESIAKSGKIQSTKAFSHSSEGTSFAQDWHSAEDAVNFGKTKPTPENPTYVLEVKSGSDIKVDPRDFYPKANDPIPADRIQRAWKFTSRENPVPVKLVKGEWREIKQPRVPQNDEELAALLQQSIDMTRR